MVNFPEIMCFQFCCILNSLLFLEHIQDDAVIVVNKPPGMPVQVGSSDFLFFNSQIIDFQFHIVLLIMAGNLKREALA